MTVQPKRSLKVEKLARIYDEEIAPVWGTRFGKMLLRDLRVPDRGQVLDISCGTGYPTTEILRRMSDGSRLIAIDASSAMLDVARRKIAELGPIGKKGVFFRTESAVPKLSFADDVYDLVVCNLVLEHIENLPLLFSEASRCLAERGCFFVSELHPFRQYQGTKANFQRDQETTEIPAFVHHISDFLNAADSSGFALKHLKEWWHTQDRDKPPRLVSFWFEKQSPSR